jgi:3-isopropylmalate dehydrogenase
LRHSLGLEREARAVEAAVETVLTDGARTADLGGQLGSRQMADAILAQLAAAAAEPV